jgi:hypothetical protein
MVKCGYAQNIPTGSGSNTVLAATEAVRLLNSLFCPCLAIKWHTANHDSIFTEKIFIFFWLR